MKTIPWTLGALLAALLAHPARVLAEPAEEVSAACARYQDLRVFRARLPLSRLEGVDLRQLRVRPAAGEKPNVSLVHLDLRSHFAREREGRAAAGGGDLEVLGLYRLPAACRLELWGPAPGSGEARVLKTLSLELARSPAEDQEAVRAWATAYAWDLALKLLSSRGADLGFQRFTILRLRSRFGLAAEVLPPFLLGEREGRAAPTADLYSVTTGALAIEESLQLGVALRTRPGSGGGEEPIARLQGPTIKSHPFEEMLQGRAPRLFETAALVPEDNWYAHFSTLGAEIRIADLLDQWGTSFLQMLEVSSRDRRLKEKVLGQLAIDLSVLTRLFGDLVIGDLAITGSDPYLHDGSDLTLILRVKNRALFQGQMARYRDEAKKRRPDAREGSESYQGVAISSLATPDRRISSYSADLGDFRVYSSSAAALRRVIDAQAGRRPRLAEAPDFRYMRTIFPGEPAGEDAFLYLSDRFIRNVVGPAQKIGRLRQMTCLASQRSLEFALLERALERGEAPAGAAGALEELFQKGFADPEEAFCPSGGRFEVQGGEGGPEVVCSVHNRLGLGTPLLEIPLQTATSTEAQGYREFVAGYERYWSRFFDPVGIRFKVGAAAGGGIEAETCILPLIENSIYEELRRAVGGEPVRLGGLAGPDVLGSLSLKLPRDERLLNDLAHESEGMLGRDELSAILRELGEGVTLTLHDGEPLFTFAGEEMAELWTGGFRGGEAFLIGFLLSAISLPVSLSVDLHQPEEARGLLKRLLLGFSQASGARGLRGGWRAREFSFEACALEPYRGVELGLVTWRFFIARFHFHHAIVGRKLVVATQQRVLTGMIDRFLDGGGPPDPKAGGSTAALEPANLLLEAHPRSYRRIAAAMGTLWQERMRTACFSNFPAEEVLLERLQVEPARLGATSLRLFGYTPFCPAGGTVALGKEGGPLSCSVHQRPEDPRQPLLARGDEPFLRFVESLKHIRASFSFTPEGIRTRVLIEREPPAGPRTP